MVQCRHKTYDTRFKLRKAYFLHGSLSNVVYITIGSNLKNYSLLARSFSRVSTHLLRLVYYKTNFVKTNINGKKFVKIRTCPQKIVLLSFLAHSLLTLCCYIKSICL